MHILPEAYMREDIYLIRWLRGFLLIQCQYKASRSIYANSILLFNFLTAKNFNAADAKSMLLEVCKFKQIFSTKLILRYISSRKKQIISYKFLS